MPRHPKEPPEPSRSTFLSIGEVFYRARVLRGREWSLRRFAEALEIDHVMLSLIEKGQRFPNEDVVRRLAAMEGTDPTELIAILYRDRMRRALDREIRRVVLGPASSESGETSSEREGSLSVVLAQALAALPDNGSPVADRTWHRAVRKALREEFGRATRKDFTHVVELLARRELVEMGDGAVRKLGGHLDAVEPNERLDLALDLSELFGKALTDALVRSDTDTYLRKHFLNLPASQLEAFQAALDKAIREVVERFARDDDDDEQFLQVLVAGTTKR